MADLYGILSAQGGLNGTLAPPAESVAQAVTELQAQMSAAESDIDVLNDEVLSTRTNATNHAAVYGYINASTGAPQEATSIKYRRTARIRAYEPGLTKITLTPKRANTQIRVYFYSDPIRTPLASYFIETFGPWADAVEITPTASKPYMIVAVVSTADPAEDLSGYNYADLVNDEREYNTALALADIITKDDPVYVLGIGNSYLYYAFSYLAKILWEAGYTNVVLGMGYRGGATLAEQYAARTDNTFYSNGFCLWPNNGVASYTYDTGFSLSDILTSQPWTHVIIQQQSDESGQYDSFVSPSFDINDLLSFVTASVSDPIISLFAPWTHAADYAGELFAQYYNSDPSLQEAAIRTVIPQVAAHMTRCDYIINELDAFEGARGNAFLEAIGDEMMRSDGNHPAYGIPMYLAACVIAMTLFDVDINSLTWYPTTADDSNIATTTSAYYGFLARQYAKVTVL